MRNTDTCYSGKHPWTPENIYVNPRGGRCCRKCLNEASKRYHQRKRRQRPPRLCACGREIKGRRKVCAICKDSRRNSYDIHPDDRAAIYKRDGHKCLRCGETDDLTIDHILPRAIGGKDHRSNYQTLCRPCNTAKGATYADYRPGANNQLTLALEPPKPSLRDRFMDKVEVQDDGCWLWTGARVSTGNGAMNLEGRLETAVRIAWLLEYGEMPQKRLYRACGGDCVNAKHLTTTSPQSQWTTCPKGHAYIDENVVYEGDRRRCRACKKARQRQYHARKKQKARD